jgi:hypothetical protein
VRRGRKAAGLEIKMAELPKDEPPVSSAFFDKSAKVTKGKVVNN